MPIEIEIKIIVEIEIESNCQRSESKLNVK